jgi:hypothetical protein
MLFDTAEGELGELLLEITRQLQLDETRYLRAERSYGAVGSWLKDGLSVEERHALDVYPQGSMALQTTVKPRGDGEHDLDIVAQFPSLRTVTPTGLYNWGLERLAANPYYAKILEPKNRCVRLNYAGDFHLDVLFAILDPDPGTDGTSILVPERDRRSWTPSNPRGFKRWFESQCEPAGVLLKRAQEPLPNNDPARLKAVLKQAVQLIKRQRDIWFENVDEAPKSVVLTTLSGHLYHGDGSLYASLLAILERITYSIERAAPRRLRVVNPTNAGEDFSESWDAKPGSYEAFVKWTFIFRDRMRALVNLRGDHVDHELAALFGERVARGARVAFTDRLSSAREAGTIRNAGRNLVVGTGAGTAIPRNRFFGGDE